ncbi:MAG TPA: LacI family DNA-binding transcriptional regulator [Paludibacter sp.]
MKKRITIKDIAKELNVHHSTVSRALRNDPRVNVATRDQVLAYAREHEYQTNMNAVQLRGTSNNAIALIVPNINHTFFSDIISELTNLAYQKGYVISVFQTNEKYQLEKEIVNTIIQHNFAGVIVSKAKDTINSEHFALLNKFGIPVVFFDRICDDLQTPRVIINNFEITAEATEYLIKKGYRSIAHLTGTTSNNVFRDRQNGYESMIDKYKMEYHQSIAIEDDFSVEIGKRIFAKLQNLPVKPDAIISSSVHIAIGIMLEARKSGVRIPQDLGLITFGSLLSSEIIEPRITYVDQPETEIAQLSFDLLEKMINREIPIGELIEKTVKAQIIFKESC